MPATRKTFECGHRGYGQYCHRHAAAQELRILSTATVKVPAERARSLHTEADLVMMASRGARQFEVLIDHGRLDRGMVEKAQANLAEEAARLETASTRSKSKRPDRSDQAR